MLTFDSDPVVAERQMEALLFSLTTFGYIDGDFDASEKALVRQTIERLIERRVGGAMPEATPEVRRDLVARFSTHFGERLERIDAHVRELFHEPLADGEDRDTFVYAKLKQRCFEIFQEFDRANQHALLESVDELIQADGELHPAELKFRTELAGLLEHEVEIVLEEEPLDVPRASIAPPIKISSSDDHTFFQQLEFHYSADPQKIERQVAADLALVDKLTAQLEERRVAGAGRLEGKATVAELEPGADFLDGWTHALMPEPGRAYELTVLGDLHGCYSCLKAAVMQARFFEKVAAFRRDPANHPDPKLVLLGDYIDRGKFSLNGVLRTVIQMAITAPDHVYVLRGNHEYYVEHQGQIYGGVRPAEAINTLRPHVSIDVLREYMKLFELLPNVLLFDRTMFVHAGIPRDRTIKERWRDLSSLNDPDIRFQLMWSDPSAASVIPAELQAQTARFPFGKLQFTAFMQRIGCHTMFRGHEKVEEGFRRVYDDDAGLLVTLFSAGGEGNDDLPIESSYRGVTPMAASIHRSPDGETTITPFEIDWPSYNDPERNGFRKRPPEIAHRS
jgi:hypothetical protein